MASSLALWSVAASSGALYRLINPLRTASVAPNVAFYRPTNPLRAAFVAPNVTRSFNTSSEMRLSDDDESDVQVDVERSFDSPLRSLACGLYKGIVSSLSFSDVYDRRALR
ncbi:uncharacterized protein LOC125316521 [Rhodamnia argentea]|uniref:Uncharacterized protein LOC125316521 n=1 Tax=Rhodamnia argentea TaxID=178133 RepID=A0ABM3HWH4_9MYRT|nr:uncharacterized protein LOC125316521 [Rhodamnia argentea]